MGQKTGADALAKALHHGCLLLAHYRTPLTSVIDAAVSAGAINAGQATIAKAFLTGLNDLCAVWEAIAAYNSVNP